MSTPATLAKLAYLCGVRIRLLFVGISDVGPEEYQNDEKGIIEPF